MSLWFWWKKSRTGYQLAQLAERLGNAIGSASEPGQGSVTRASYGVAVFPEDGSNVQRCDAGSGYRDVPGKTAGAGLTGFGGCGEVNAVVWAPVLNERHTNPAVGGKSANSTCLPVDY